MGMTERRTGMTDKMGTIHRAPTLGKIKKDIDSRFRGCVTIASFAYNKRIKIH